MSTHTWKQEPMWIKRNDQGVVIEIREKRPKEVGGEAVYTHKGFRICSLLPRSSGYYIADDKFSNREFNLVQDAIDAIERGDDIEPVKNPVSQSLWRN